jgi:hypothetical protein
MTERPSVYDVDAGSGPVTGVAMNVSARTIGFLFMLCAGAQVALAQSVPPVMALSATAPEEHERKVQVTEARTWFPVRDTASAEALWDREDSVNFADQVQFLYGFGDKQRKALASDLFALIFPYGVRVGIGASVASDDAKEGSEDDAAAKAIARLREGGDMYLTVAYPVMAASKGHVDAQLFGVSRTNFLIENFGATDTLTESTERSWTFGLEGSAQVAAISSKGLAFISGRWGVRRVSDAFKTVAKLESNVFSAMQVAVGVQFNESLRLSFQRFQAPPAAVGATSEQLKGWHLVMEVFPAKKN